jgi:opacity protein-like surface antigen
MIKIIQYLILGLSSLIAQAGNMGAADEMSQQYPFFLEFGTGVGFPIKSNINLQSQYNLWWPTTTTYNSSLGAAPLYMAGLGYTVNELLKIDANYTFRGFYNYKNNLNYTGYAASEPNENIFFNLSSNALMFSGTLYAKGLESSYSSLASKLIKEIDGYGYIQPLIGGGLGVSYNTLSNFYGMFTSSQTVDFAMADATAVALAWQLNAGLDWHITNRFSFDLGYRYLNVGRFNSNDYLISLSKVQNGSAISQAPAWAPAWIGSLSANELYFTAKLAFG